MGKRIDLRRQGGPEMVLEGWTIFVDVKVMRKDEG